MPVDLTRIEESVNKLIGPGIIASDAHLASKVEAILTDSSRHGRLGSYDWNGLNALFIDTATKRADAIRIAFESKIGALRSLTQEEANDLVMLLSKILTQRLEALELRRIKVFLDNPGFGQKFSELCHQFQDSEVEKFNIAIYPKIIAPEIDFKSLPNDSDRKWVAIYNTVHRQLEATYRDSWRSLDEKLKEVRLQPAGSNRKYLRQLHGLTLSHQTDKLFEYLPKTLTRFNADGPSQQMDENIVRFVNGSFEYLLQQHRRRLKDYLPGSASLDEVPIDTLDKLERSISDNVRARLSSLLEHRHLARLIDTQTPIAIEPAADSRVEPALITDRSETWPTTIDALAEAELRTHRDALRERVAGKKYEMAERDRLGNAADWNELHRWYKFDVAPRGAAIYKVVRRVISETSDDWTVREVVADFRERLRVEYSALLEEANTLFAERPSRPTHFMESLNEEVVVQSTEASRSLQDELTRIHKTRPTSQGWSGSLPSVRSIDDLLKHAQQDRPEAQASTTTQQAGATAVSHELRKAVKASRLKLLDDLTDEVRQKAEEMVQRGLSASTIHANDILKLHKPYVGRIIELYSGKLVELHGDEITSPLMLDRISRDARLIFAEAVAPVDESLNLSLIATGVRVELLRQEWALTLSTCQQDAISDFRTILTTLNKLEQKPQVEGPTVSPAAPEEGFWDKHKDLKAPIVGALLVALLGGLGFLANYLYFAPRTRAETAKEEQVKQETQRRFEVRQQLTPLLVQQLQDCKNANRVLWMYGKALDRQTADIAFSDYETRCTFAHDSSAALRERIRFAYDSNTVELYDRVYDARRDIVSSAVLLRDPKRKSLGRQPGDTLFDKANDHYWRLSDSLKVRLQSFR